MGLSQADNSVKIWRNLLVSNPKPDLHNINAHTKFGENPLMFTKVITRMSNPATIVWRGIKTYPLYPYLLQG